MPAIIPYYFSDAVPPHLPKPEFPSLSVAAVWIEKSYYYQQYIEGENHDEWVSEVIKRAAQMHVQPSFVVFRSPTKEEMDQKKIRDDYFFTELEATPVEDVAQEVAAPPEAPAEVVTKVASMLQEMDLDSKSSFAKIDGIEYKNLTFQLNLAEKKTLSLCFETNEKSLDLYKQFMSSHAIEIVSGSKTLYKCDMKVSSVEVNPYETIYRFESTL